MTGTVILRRVALVYVLAGVGLLSACPEPRGETTPSGGGSLSGRAIEARANPPSDEAGLRGFVRQRARQRDDFRAQVEAVAAYRKLLANHPDEERLWQAAVETASRAAEIADRDEDVKRYAELAIQWAKQAAQKFPSDVVFPYRWAMALGLELERSGKDALDQLKVVERLAQKARQLDEKHDFAGPLRLLGALYVRAPEVGSIGDPDKGVELLERAVKLFPGHPPNHYFLGEGYYKQEEYDKARREFHAVVQASPGPGYTKRDAKWFSEHARSYLKKIERKTSSGPEV